MNFGDKVQVIDKHDKNYRSKGVIVKRDYEWDRPEDGVYMVIVKFKWVEVPYATYQLKVIL